MYPRRALNGSRPEAAGETLPRRALILQAAQPWLTIFVPREVNAVQLARMFVHFDEKVRRPYTDSGKIAVTSVARALKVGENPLIFCPERTHRCTERTDRCPDGSAACTDRRDRWSDASAARTDRRTRCADRSAARPDRGDRCTDRSAARPDRGDRCTDSSAARTDHSAARTA